LTTLRERICAAELERARQYFPSAAKVLEIGGGRGYQAAILASWGMDVTSLDIAGAAAHHPVQVYDGQRIPFPGRSFDAVFSSNVLEHVEDVEALLGEAARVLKARGVMVHVLPSATWRWWTSVAHYVWVVLSVILRRPNPEAPDAAPRRPRSPLNLLRFAWLIALSARARRLFERGGGAVLLQPPSLETAVRAVRLRGRRRQAGGRLLHRLQDLRVDGRPAPHAAGAAARFVVPHLRAAARGCRHLIRGGRGRILARA